MPFYLTIPYILLKHHQVRKTKIFHPAKFSNKMDCLVLELVNDTTHEQTSSSYFEDTGGIN